MSAAKEPELLDIAQAAALLQVSEASLRRWTNRGQLPCLRIGGRRERRFRRADLIAFLEEQSNATLVGHLCGLYTSDLARTRQAARLIGDGLDAGSVCLLVAQPEVRRRVMAQLGRRRPSLRRARDPQHLIVTEYADAAPAQLAYWETRFETATRNGAKSIRVVGDVSGARLARGKDFRKVLEYEAAYEKLSRRFPVATMCLYDARAHSGLQTAGVLAVHPDLFRQPVAHLVS
jgi:transcriptional repressor of dcmA and dcmR